MSNTQNTCPQCGSTFDQRDGYPDLYGVKLCSPGCQTEWLIRHRYRSTLTDDPSPQLVEDVGQQLGDGAEGDVQTDNRSRPGKLQRQME